MSRTVVGSALAIGVVAAQSAAAQGVGYTLAPAASRLQWTNQLGLDNSTLYGGLLSLDFDRFASLQGYYLTNSNTQTALGRLALQGPITGLLGDQQLGVRSYGANILLSLWSGGAVAPFVKGGGGILELRPDVGGKSKQVALNFGGGLRFGGNGPVFLDLFAEDMVFRLDRYSLFAPVGGAGTTIPADPDANKLRHNLAFGASVGLPLGPARGTLGSDDTGPFQWGVAGASLTFEPMAGRLVFDDDASFGDQDLVGIRGGIDLGRLVGLRGFYWRGTENDFKRTAPVQSFGAEAQFRLNSGPGLTPYLLVGGAQLDFLGDFRTLQGTSPADKTALLLGGGMTIPLSERFGINVTARDYLFGAGNGVDSVSSPSDLKSNWMFSAGLRVNVGGRAGTRVAARARDRDRRYATRLDSLRRENARLDSLVGEDAELDSLRAENQRLATRLGLATQQPTDSSAVARRQAVLRGDSTAVARDSVASSDRRTAIRELYRRRARGDTAFAGEVDLAPERTDYSTDRMLTLPVPALGELYVRYGPASEGRAPMVMRSGEPRSRLVPSDDAASAWNGSMGTGTLAPDDIRRLVREAMREEMRAMFPAHDMSAPAYLSPERDDAATDRSLRARMERERLMRDRSDVRTDVRTDSSRRIPLQPKERSERPLTSNAPVRGSEMTSEDMAAVLGNRIDATLDTRLTRMDERLARMEDSLRFAMRDEVRRSMEAERAAAAASAPATVTSAPAPSVTTTREVVVQRPRPVSTYRGPRLTTYSGFNVSNAGQILLGGRFDAGAVNWQSPGIRFVPELALGFGSGGQSTMIVGNALYRFGTARLGSLPPITPHVIGGLGLLNFSDRVGSRDGLEAVVNLGYGVSFPLGGWSIAGERPVIQVEHQGVDFFDLNRILIGLQWGTR